ncbi:Protein of unknown function [Pyronema omphalodes CBS 100304]|uniref:Uncharacterized protein n=1 Tax=Pyronema omphalodes (strain CBS 100304) TaxID=1076935 RepID=U4LTD1_PYROM|nr:Protein of unknown function [Pyronema omphalodes CBS 100304]
MLETSYWETMFRSYNPGTMLDADLQLEELDIPGSEGQKKLSARKNYFNTIAPNFLKHPSIFYQTYNRKEIVEIAYKDAVYLLGVGGDDNLDQESPKLQEFRPKENI